LTLGYSPFHPYIAGSIRTKVGCHMGFYIRKSVRVGPFRFNLSKSGIGVSAGVKGFRVGSGPRGNYVHAGRGGLYYRETLPSLSEPRSLTPRVAVSGPAPERITHETLIEIESGNVSQMTSSSAANLLAELNSKQAKIPLWPFVTGLLALVWIVVAVHGVSSWTLITLAIVGLVGAVLVSRYDEVRKCTVVFYDFDAEMEAAYQDVHDTFEALSRSAYVWHVESSGRVFDRKYHAGASSLVQRKTIKLRVAAPPYVKTNIGVPAIPVGRQTLWFFPDHLLVYDSGKVGAVEYTDLELEGSSTRFVENGTAPLDATVVGQTWRFVNKSGGPDRRFSSNAELPICMYGQLALRSDTGLNELIQTSRQAVIESFVQSVLALAVERQSSRVSR